MAIAAVRGSFGTFAGQLEIGGEGTVASGTVEAATIDTNAPGRDEHLSAQGANEARTDETLDGVRPRTLAGANTREVP
jgi:polyisoprenoid-binding protein YceI